MNLLHVVNIYFVIPYFLGDQLVYFKNKGYNEYIVCSPSDEIEKYAHVQMFEYQEVPIDRKMSFIRDIKAIKAIRNYININNIDVVTGHTPKGALLGMIAAWLERIPKRIYFRHGLVFETATGFKRSVLIMIDKFTAKLATEIINVSPSVAKRSIKEKLNPPYKQSTLSKGTCNGISMRKFNKDNLDINYINSIKRKLNIDSKSFIIGYTGRLVKDKGISELVQAFKRLERSFPHVKLLLVGMFEERDALPDEIIEFIKTDPNIIHVGYVNYNEIEYYYSLMDIFVLLSYREGFPTSILEASAMGLPILTTRATGCIDSIIEGKTGLFVTHNQNDIIKAIKQFIVNEEQRRIFGTAGREFVEINFASEIIWQELEKIYKK